jgi:hypothetical protein
VPSRHFTLLQTLPFDDDDDDDGSGGGDDDDDDDDGDDDEDDVPYAQLIKHHAMKTHRGVKMSLHQSPLRN